MKIKIPKFVTGIIITLAGAAATAIPLIAPAGPYLMKLGIGVAGIGLAAKGVRAVREKSIATEVIWEHEKQIIDKMKG